MRYLLHGSGDSGFPLIDKGGFVGISENQEGAGRKIYETTNKTALPPLEWIIS